MEYLFLIAKWQHYWSVFVFWLPLTSIPIVGGVVGWGTNVIALKMTFYPLDFVGIRPYFGWQGIIPSKAAKMATISVDLMTEKLIDVKEVFARLDPDKVVAEMRQSLEQISVQIMDEVMQAQAPTLWNTLPQKVKQPIYDRALHILPQTISHMMDDMKHDISNLIDLKKLAVDTLMQDKRLINEIFLKVGDQEFRFIEVSGWYFGFILGIPQMITSYFYNPWWMLPLFGLVIGYLTNWLALKMIFEPIKPINILGYKLQGIFIKRQQQVSLEYARIISEKILTTEALFRYIVRSGPPGRFEALVKKHVDKAFDSIAGEQKSYLELAIGSRRMAAAHNVALYRFMEEVPIAFTSVYKYAESALKIENTLASRMSSLTEVEFVDFLRPVFREDEMKLIIVGAVLGFLAGLVQYYVGF